METGTAGDVVAEAIACAKKAHELRGATIEKLLEQREKIDQDLKTLGHVPTSLNGNGRLQNTRKATPKANSSAVEQAHLNPRRFKDLALAAIGRTLLGEHGTLHGKDIERLAKAGGFKKGGKHFQNYMPTAFRRDGGFENIGGNTWKLREST